MFKNKYNLMIMVLGLVFVLGGCLKKEIDPMIKVKPVSVIEVEKSNKQIDVIGDGIDSKKNKEEFILPKVECQSSTDYDKMNDIQKYIIHQNCIFWEGKLVDGVDYNTFVDLGYRYAKDKNSVYHWGRKINPICFGMGDECVKIDPDTFVVISDYAKDKDYVYYYAEIVPGADSKTFTYLGNAYGKDAKRIYYGGEILYKADVTSFRYLGGVFGNDKNFVFAKTQSMTVSDKQTFEVLNEYYAKDKDNIYCLDKKIDNVDRDTFQIIDHFYAKDKNHIYHLGEPISIYEEGVLVREADAQTFEIIEKHYSKDKDYIFLRNGVLGHVSLRNDPYVPLPESIQILDSRQNCVSYKNEVYCWQKIPGADPSTFKYFNNSDYAKDNNFVYFKNKKIIDADIATFEVVSNIYGYAKDKNYIYFRGQRSEFFIPSGFAVSEFGYISDSQKLGFFNSKNWSEKKEVPIISILENMDMETLQIQDSYAWDKNLVYISGIKAENIDASSFQILKSNYTKDKNHIYYFDHVFYVANPYTFEVIDGSYYSKDDKNVYINETIIKGADTKSFKLLTEFYSIDKNNAYFREVRLDGADPATFKVVAHEEAEDKNNKYYRERKSGK